MLTAEQLRAARALNPLGSGHGAERAGVSIETSSGLRRWMARSFDEDEHVARPGGSFSGWRRRLHQRGEPGVKLVRRLEPSA